MVRRNAARNGAIRHDRHAAHAETSHGLSNPGRPAPPTPHPRGGRGRGGAGFRSAGCCHCALVAGPGAVLPRRWDARYERCGRPVETYRRRCEREGGLLPPAASSLPGWRLGPSQPHGSSEAVMHASAGSSWAESDTGGTRQCRRRMRCLLGIESRGGPAFSMA